MADVQIDSGEFTRIANILLEKTAQLHLNGTQYSIILTVWRFTYGFQRREHEMSITFIANATKSPGRVIKRELKALIDRKIILVTKESTKAESRTLKFNKDFEAWIEGTKKTPQEEGTKWSPGDQIVPCEGTNQSPEEGTNQTPNKERKENIKKDIYIVFSHWNSKKIITHRTLTQKLSGHINARLGEGFSVEEILSAIDNYDTILKDNDLYFWSYKWGLGDFLIRGLDKFKTESDPFKNYKKKDKPPPKGSTDNLGKSQKGKYEEFYL